MKPRPTSVTVIAWVLIVGSVLTLFTTLLTLNNPKVQELMARSSIPIPAQYAVAYTGLAIRLLCGIAMLNAKNWSRVLYAVWGGLMLLISFATSPMKLAMIPATLFFAIIVLLLFQPRASDYFTRTDNAGDA